VAGCGVGRQDRDKHSWGRAAASHNLTGRAETGWVLCATRRGSSRVLRHAARGRLGATLPYCSGLAGLKRGRQKNKPNAIQCAGVHVCK
jgi:hypothetical protein